MYKHGEKNWDISPFKFITVHGEVKTLNQAYERYSQLIFPHATNQTNSATHLKVLVNVEDQSEAYPQLETDESYTLKVDKASKEQSIVLSSKTIYGALRGIETLSQLVIFDFDSHSYYIPAIPIYIEDAPRYPHRGMLLDTSRHYEPIPLLQKTIDALSYAKYNVLHWHVVDTQSFPFESKTYPKLWNGAYSKAEKYTQEDIQSIVEYGRLRGVKVMIEFDMPGHAAAWCAGYPSICPSPQCLEPLNPASDLTFPLITSLIGECAGSNGSPALFPYSLLHLGGDEVDYTCWEQSKEIQTWEAEQGLNGSEETYKYFVDKAANITRSADRLPVQWVEVFEHFGSNLDHNTIVHVWKEKTTLDGVLQAGYRALLSNQDSWYLE